MLTGVFAHTPHACSLCRWEERPQPPHNWTKFIEAKRKELQRLNNAYKNTLSNAKVELLQGFGKVLDPHTVDIDGKKYTVRVGRWYHRHAGLLTPLQSFSSDCAASVRKCASQCSGLQRLARVYGKVVSSMWAALG